MNDVYWSAWSVSLWCRNSATSYCLTLSFCFYIINRSYGILYDFSHLHCRMTNSYEHHVVSVIHQKLTQDETLDDRYYFFTSEVKNNYSASTGVNWQKFQLGAILLVLQRRWSQGCLGVILTKGSMFSYISLDRFAFRSYAMCFCNVHSNLISPGSFLFFTIRRILCIFTHLEFRGESRNIWKGGLFNAYDSSKFLR